DPVLRPRYVDLDVLVHPPGLVVRVPPGYRVVGAWRRRPSDKGRHRRRFPAPYLSPREACCSAPSCFFRGAVSPQPIIALRSYSVVSRCSRAPPLCCRRGHWSARSGPVGSARPSSFESRNVEFRNGMLACHGFGIVTLRFGGRRNSPSVGANQDRARPTLR